MSTRATSEQPSCLLINAADRSVALLLATSDVSATALFALAGAEDHVSGDAERKTVADRVSLTGL